MDFSAQIQQLLKDKAFHVEQVKLIEDAVGQLSALNQNPLFKALASTSPSMRKSLGINISAEVDAILADFTGEFTAKDLARAIAKKHDLNDEAVARIYGGTGVKVRNLVREGVITQVREGRKGGNGGRTMSVYRRTDAIPQPQARVVRNNGVSIAMDELRGHFAQQA